MINTDGKYYLGKIVNPQTNEKTDTPLLYDPDDLTTHAVVLGMTGSGKTGLCLDLLEEAALNKVPALLIDPKGDITNAILHFPDLAPADFAPWINAAAAEREGKTVEQAAQETADLWRNGLADWDIGPERIQALTESVQFSVYTPGSDAGLSLSILASLKAPDIPWAGNEEALREQISGTVTAILGLAGLTDIDPVRSREHILLANIFEYNWSRGQDLDLAALIMQTQSPPFAKLGVFDVNTFFPEKDRFDLAMSLNNILAAPSFQNWLEGDPLDVQSLLYMPDGRPRHTIFYIAHLPEEERMFFVTLLYSAVESWMRSQKGTTSLRAIVYFDEIFGYLPPVGNPPSKEPMLRMLKQARAFGVGLILATQNPVDVDYKALSNAGTWFIGKLATEQDKERLLDGLATAAQGGLDRREYDRLISTLGKRVFLLRNVHDKQPTLFQTRWAMNYLAGPVTRTQISALNTLAGIGAQYSGGSVQSSVEVDRQPAASGQPLAASDQPALPGTSGKPTVPRGVQAYILPVTLTPEEGAQVDGRSLPLDAERIGTLYRPVLLAQAEIRVINRKYGLNLDLWRTAVVPEPDDRGMVRWEEFLTGSVAERQLERMGVADGRYADLMEPFTDAKIMRALKNDFTDWVYRETEIEVKANESLKVYAGPDVSEADFAAMCQKAAQKKMETEAKKVAAAYDKKIDRIEDKLKREERELAEDEAEYKQRSSEEMLSHAETLFSLFSRRRKSLSSSMSKRRMTAKAKADIEESKDAIAEYKEEISALEEEAEEALQEIKEKWEEIAADATTILVTPYKKDINVAIFGLAWMPYHLVQLDNNIREVPAFVIQEE